MQTKQEIQYALKFQFITNDYSEISHEEQVKKVLEGGCRWIQLRIKEKSDAFYIETAKRIKKLCHDNNAVFIINDKVDIAKAIDADGVHLGKSDLSPLEAREILGSDKIIGGTANTFEDIEELSQQKVDYIGLGPFRFTTTKKVLSPVLGLTGYKEIIDKCIHSGLNTPIVGIGGVKQDDIKPLIGTGLYGVAVSSVLSEAVDINIQTKKFIQEINN